MRARASESSEASLARAALFQFRRAGGARRRPLSLMGRRRCFIRSAIGYRAQSYRRQWLLMRW